MTGFAERECGVPARGHPLTALGTLLPILLIVAAALAYYGSYLRYWFNPHDEGGTVCLVAQRLLAGERPWVDVDPGYNIGWFYPVVWLFKFTGVNYLVARAWFFFLATLTAVLGFSIVNRVTGSRVLGVIVGLLLVALPGSQFKNYIPLAEMANTACLIFLTHLDPAQRQRRLGAALLGGLVLGLTYLVRVDLGIFFSVIWLGVFALSLLDRRVTSGWRRTGMAASGVVFVCLGILFVQTPAYLACRSGGLESDFLGVYLNWPRFLQYSLEQRFRQIETQAPPAPSAPLALKPGPAEPPPAVEPTPEPASSLSVAVAESTETSTLRRQPFSAIWRASGRNRVLPFLTYAPLPSFSLFLVLAAVRLARELGRRQFTLAEAPMQWLLLIGGSLTTFPQFFFFRPDRPHLSEFMPSFIVAMAGSAWLLWRHAQDRRILHRAGAWLYLILLAIHLCAFAIFAFEHPSAGTIAARKSRKIRFAAENGVKVFVSKREAQTLSGVRDAVLQNSRADDYLICYPYMPGYNVMTNRRTYVRNVYVDNGTHSSGWSDATIHEFETRRPAVVIIDDRPINGLDASRFSQWAAKAYAFLRENYALAGQFDEGKIEVFANPSSLRNPTPSP